MSSFLRLLAAGCLMLVVPFLQVEAQTAPSTLGASIGAPALDGAFNQLQQAATALTGTAAALATGAADATAAAVGAALGPAAAPLEAAPGPRPAPLSNVTSNIAFAVTAASATFGPNTLFLQDISPAVTYFATVPVYHAGNLNTTSFLNLTNNGSWLGNPDAALMGSMNGSKVVVLLSIGGPTLKGRTAIFKAFLLGPTATPLLLGGPVAAFLNDQALAAAITNPTFLASVNGKTVLTDVSLVVESAMVQVPTAGLKSQQATVTASNDGFTYDCAANTPWKPIYCGSFGGFYGGGYNRGFLG